MIGKYHIGTKEVGDLMWKYPKARIDNYENYRWINLERVKTHTHTYTYTGKATIDQYQLDKKEMEALLCEDPKAPKGNKKKVAAKKEKKNAAVNLLDAKRQQNIGL